MNPMAIMAQLLGGGMRGRGRGFNPFMGRGRGRGGYRGGGGPPNQNNAAKTEEKP